MSEIPRFLIVGMQRSGTTVTHAAVRQHPEVRTAFDEVLADPMFTRGLATFFVSGRETFEARDRGMRQLFDAVAGVTSDDTARVAGVKAAVGEYDTVLGLHAALIEHFPTMKVVIVQRRDLVAQFGSKFRARKTGVWHTESASGSNARVRIKLPVKEFDAYAREAVRIYRVWDRIAETHDTLRFVYEEHIDGGFQHERLYEFLGIQAVEPTWLRMSKVSPPPQDYIENYDQLRSLQEDIEANERFDTDSDFVDRLVSVARGDDELLLIDRAKSRLARGWTSEAAVDIRELLRRLPDLAAWSAGAAHALSVIGGLSDEVASDAFDRFRSESPFHLHASRIFREAGRVSEALCATVDAVSCAAKVEKWWLSLIRSTWDELDQGQRDAAIQEFADRAGDRGVLAATALIASSEGDRQRANATVARVRDQDAELGRLLESMVG